MGIGDETSPDQNDNTADQTACVEEWRVTPPGRAFRQPGSGSDRGIGSPAGSGLPLTGRVPPVKCTLSRLILVQ